MELMKVNPKVFNVSDLDLKIKFAVWQRRNYER